MKINITFNCGHTAEVTLFGGKYPEQIARLEGQDCRECYLAWKKAKQEEAEAARVAGGYKPLAGSEKQIAWASSIRGKLIDQLLNDVFATARPEDFNGHPKEEVIQLVVNALPDSASFWIDQRDTLWQEIPGVREAFGAAKSQIGM